jgi:hypothetical protein
MREIESSRTGFGLLGRRLFALRREGLLPSGCMGAAAKSVSIILVIAND